MMENSISINPPSQWKLWLVLQTRLRSAQASLRSGRYRFASVRTADAGLFYSIFFFSFWNPAATENSKEI
jgi:hypothetical protein